MPAVNEDCPECVPTTKAVPTKQSAANRATPTSRAVPAAKGESRGQRGNGPAACQPLFQEAERCMLESKSTDWTICRQQLDLFRKCTKAHQNS